MPVKNRILFIFGLYRFLEGLYAAGVDFSMGCYPTSYMRWVIQIWVRVAAWASALP